MQELFAMKGDNVAQNALSSIQYQPHEGDTTAAVPAVHRVIGQRHGFDPSLTDAFNEWDTIEEEQCRRHLQCHGHLPGGVAS